MKKKLCAFAFAMVLVAIQCFAQDNWRYFQKDNISFNLPENWQITDKSKNGADIVLYAKDASSGRFVEIRRLNSKKNLKVRVNDLAMQRLQNDNFQYMQIDKVVKTQFKQKDAQLLNYTNTYLNDVYKGGIYSFVSEGYTYTVEYYGENKPEVEKLLLQIVNTLNVNSADKKENIADESKEYDADNWQENSTPNDILAAEKEAQEAKQRAEEEAQKAKAKSDEERAKADKELVKQQEKLSKRQREMEEQQEKIAKQQEKLAKKKIEEEKKKKEAEEKQRRKEMKIDELTKHSKKIDKELNDTAKEQLKLSEDYGKAQLKSDTKKMEKITKQQEELAKKVVSLKEDKSKIQKELSKF